MRSAAAVEEALDDFGARDLRQHQPRVKCVSGGRVSGADESRPSVQGFDFDIGILPGNESDICRLIAKPQYRRRQRQKVTIDDELASAVDVHRVGEFGEASGTLPATSYESTSARRAAAGKRALRAA